MDSFFERDDLEQLADNLDRLVEQFPQRRKEYHERLAKRMKTLLDGEIAGSINDAHGKIRGWQEAATGRGGYAAVRPVKAGATGDHGSQPYPITGYLDNGRTRHYPKPGRKPKGERHLKKDTYLHRVEKSGWVEGAQFYAAARNRINALALELAEEFVDELRREVDSG
nr:MAG TPA: hypothetical protein [Caudoviricetes sp.]